MKDNILEIEDFSKEMVIKVTNAYQRKTKAIDLWNFINVFQLIVINL